MIRREHVKDIRTLAQALAYELNGLAFDILEKASYLSKIELIDILGSALDALRDDTGEYYQGEYERLSEEFFKNEAVV